MLHRFSRRLLHILYPTKCPVCGEIIDCFDNFCPACTAVLPHYDGDDSIVGSDGFVASFYYCETIAPAIMLLKDGICGNADYALGNSLADSVAEFEFSAELSMIIPVPLHKKDYRKRGYNQSELIARQLSRRLGIPFRNDIIRKIRRTAEQKSLSQAERMVNLSNAFSAVKPDEISGKNILVIDDVCTTGATLAEVTALLRQHGASRVYCASCCKTPSEV